MDLSQMERMNKLSNAVFYTNLNKSGAGLYPKTHIVPGDGRYAEEYNFNLVDNIKPTNDLDKLFSQESPYQYPQLIMTKDPYQLRVDQFYLDNNNSDLVTYSEENCLNNQRKLGESRGYPQEVLNGIQNNYIGENNSGNNSKENFHNGSYQKFGVNDPNITYNFEPFNTRSLNTPNLHEGYARNIDLDSELKRINHVGDNCFYDNYKLHPDESNKCSGLYHHRTRLVNDYTPVNKNPCVQYPENGDKSIITPPSKQPIMPILEKESTNEVIYGDFTVKNSPTDRWNMTSCRLENLSHATCLKKFESFPQQDPMANNPNLTNSAKILLSHQKELSGQMPGHYNFNQKDYTENYPPQRLFNNFTKRSILPNMHNTYDINPNLISS